MIDQIRRQACIPTEAVISYRGKAIVKEFPSRSGPIPNLSFPIQVTKMTRILHPLSIVKNFLSDPMRVNPLHIHSNYYQMLKLE